MLTAVGLQIQQKIDNSRDEEQKKKYEGMLEEWMSGCAKQGTAEAGAVVRLLALRPVL